VELLRGKRGATGRLRLWHPKPGDPYDYDYPHEFFQAFSRVADLRSFRSFNVVTQQGAGDHVMDMKLVFEPR